MRGILNRKRHENHHKFLCKAYSLASFLLGMGAFIGTIAYIVFLFYYRKFSELPQWAIKVFVPKTSDGSEVLVKFTDSGIKKCNLATLIVSILTVIFAIVSWIALLPKKRKVKTLLLIVSFAISIVGGLTVVFKCGISIWLKIVFTAVGSVSWFILVCSSGGEQLIYDKPPLWVYSMAISMLVFTTGCWVYIGASNWWC